MFSVLYGFWAANYMAFNGNVMRALATQFLALAEKQGATVPLMIGHRSMGNSICLHRTMGGSPKGFDTPVLQDPKALLDQLSADEHS